MIEIMRDFQGWPVKAHTLREILLSLGFEEDSETITLIKGEENMKLLDSYPHLLEDDGMGYGVNEEYITEVDNNIYETDIVGEKINVFNMFREKVIPEEVNKIREEEKEIEERLKKWKEENDTTK